VGLALDARERVSLDALGADAVIEPAVSRDELLAAVRGSHDDEAAASPTPAPQARERGEDAGSVVAIVGAKGAPGASECAASLAELAARQWPTVLVEADALGGGLDVRLGADPANGSLVGLIRAAVGGTVQRELIERWITEVDGWPPVLLGPPEPDALSELAEPGAMANALHELVTNGFALAVCDVGAQLGDDGLSPAARVHRETLVAADAVVLVLGSRDVQLRNGLKQLDLLLGTLGIPSERLRIVANAIGGPGSASRGEITETITRHLAERGVTVDAWLPWDDRALRRAQRAGTTLAGRGRGGYARAADALLRDLFLPATSSPTPRGRKRRIVPPRASRTSEDREVVVWQP
jgi:Mrp family chromosome partitioning ATPase